MRGLVYGVYVLEILQVIFILMFAWDMFVNGYGNPSVLFVITWPDAAHSMTGALIAGMVQLFFAWRVYSLRKHSLLVRGVSILIVLLGLLQTLSGIVGASLFLEASAKSSNSELAKLSSLVELWLISSFVCDLVVATAMTAILINYSNRSLVKSTRAMVKNLVIHSVETGTVTVAAALLDLVLFLVFPDNYLHLCINTILSKLYSNALLASLNARKGLENGTSVYWDTAGGNTSRTYPNSFQLSRQDRTGGTDTGIHVSTHKATAIDSSFPVKVCLMLDSE